MASGLPSVVTRQGAVADLVLPGETGFVCADNPAEFAAAVITLRDQPAMREQMAFKSRQLAAQRPWEHILAQLEAHYSEAVTLNQRLLRLYPPTEGLSLASLFNRG
jgi:glycosyltransferase involved in cell wall biosynthesis